MLSIFLQWKHIELVFLIKKSVPVSKHVHQCVGAVLGLQTCHHVFHWLLVITAALLRLFLFSNVYVCSFVVWSLLCVLLLLCGCVAQCWWLFGCSIHMFLFYESVVRRCADDTGAVVVAQANTGGFLCWIQRPGGSCGRRSNLSSAISGQQP